MRFTHMAEIQTNKKANGCHAQPNRTLAILNLVVTGNYMFYTLMCSLKRVDQIHLKCGQKSLKALMMLSCKDCEFSSNGVAVAAQQISISCHETTSSCNLAVHGQICPKFHMLDNSPGLKISAWQNSVILIAPPSGKRKLQALL